MAFPTDSVAKRNDAVRRRRYQEYLDRQLELARLAEKERKEYEVRELLKERIPEVQEDIAWRLWEIVANLTNDLVAKFENGDSELKTAGYYHLELFYERDRSNLYASALTKDMGYLDVLAKMATLYNALRFGCDIGQTFELERSMKPIPQRSRRRRGYDDTVYARVTATVALPPE